MTFQDVMKEVFQHVFQEKHFTILNELSDEGIRYHNSVYEVTIQRERKMEEQLRQAYPGNMFFAYFTNDYFENECALDVIFHIGSVRYLLSCEIHQIQEGTINLFCGLYRNGKRTFDATFEEILGAFPDIDHHFVKFLETHPSYRLYFVTREITLECIC